MSRNWSAVENNRAVKMFLWKKMFSMQLKMPDFILKTKSLAALSQKIAIAAQCEPVVACRSWF